VAGEEAVILVRVERFHLPIKALVMFDSIETPEPALPFIVFPDRVLVRLEPVILDDMLPTALLAPDTAVSAFIPIAIEGIGAV
jgi:hypothetical protein